MNNIFPRKKLTDVTFFQEGPGLRKWQWTNDGMKVINVTNILGDEAFTVDTTNTDKYISLVEFDGKYKHFEVDNGDYVVASSGNTYGKVGRITERNLPLMMNTSVIRFRSINKENLDDRYFFCFLRSNDFMGQVNSYVTGGAQPNFGPTHLKKMDIPVPEITVQRKIGSIVGEYDDLIENNRRRIQLLEESARLLYKEWFVHLRFPGHEHVKITDGVPEGWNVKGLTDIAIVNEKSLKKGFDGEIEYVDIASVSPNAVNETTWYEFSEAPGRARRVLKHKDIIWSCVRPNRRSHAFVWKPHDRLIASTGFAVISSKNISPCYLYQYLTTNDYVGYLTNHAGGAAYPAVTAKVFEKSEILVPDEKLQIEFEEFVGIIFQEKQLLSDQVKKLAEARDILLPRLMSGELAV